MSHYHYIGNELELFAHAVNWKSYYRRFLQRLGVLQGDVLEVGAGIGGTTKILCDGTQTQWVCLEPDPQMGGQITELIRQKQLPSICRPVIGTLATWDSSQRFDSLLYIDVLEHIEHDRAELEQAAQWLKPQGTVVVLSPAHPWLYSPFDRAIGHYRRYTRPMLRAITPPQLKIQRMVYLDSVGLLASSGNRFIQKRAMPTLKQIHLWDRCMVPLSRCLDPLLGHHLGKSVVAVWRKA